MRLFGLCVAVWVACASAYAGVLPSQVLDTHAEVTSMRQKGENLYVSTSQGEVQIYALAGDVNLKLRLVRRIELPSYEDLFGSSFRPKVFNTDTNARGEILIIATGAKRKPQSVCVQR